MKNMNITEIENLTYEEAKNYALEEITIKEHDCFLIDFEGYFGYSILVFKNGKHIHYANDYELHHSYMVKKDGKEGLKKYYIQGMENKLFTDAEMLEPCKSYSEYERKNHFLRNYWIMRYDYMSVFFIGNDAERAERQKLIEKEFPYFNPVCFCYVKEKSIIEKAKKYYDILEDSYNKLITDDGVFREMVRKELANHEACITCDYTDAMDALGLKFEELTEDRQKIVKEELRRQIESYC